MTSMVKLGRDHGIPGVVAESRKSRSCTERSESQGRVRTRVTEAAMPKLGSLSSSQSMEEIPHASVMVDDF